MVIALLPTMAGARVTILVIEVVLVALVQTATAREGQHTNLPQGPLTLVEPKLTVAALPIEGLKASELHDNFEEIRNGHRHEAIDIIKPNHGIVRRSRSTRRLIFRERIASALGDLA